MLPGPESAPRRPWCGPWLRASGARWPRGPVKTSSAAVANSDSARAKAASDRPAAFALLDGVAQEHEVFVVFDPFADRLHLLARGDARLIEE